MKVERKSIVIFLGVLLAVQVSVERQVSAQEKTIDAQKIERLERLIRDQQQQLESMQQQLNELKQTAAVAQTQASEAKSVAEEAKTTAGAFSLEKVLTTDQDRIKLAISGQIDRAVNVVDDGAKTRAYFVDNDASNSRLRLIGTARATDDLTLGTRFEVAIAPNESAQVSQTDQEPGTYFDQRWVDLYLDSKRFGKLSLGKGDTASNNTAEVDLSKTDVVAYASVSAIVGGMLFRTKDTNVLTNFNIADAFDDLDGLSRKSRVRYDTPTFYGFSLAGSLVSDSRHDGSIWWSGKGGGFKAAAAFAYADPNLENCDQQYDGSFSVLHENTGLNLTLSAGVQDFTNQSNPSNFYVKAGWLANLFHVGETAFSVDYDKSQNFPAENYDGWSMGGAVVQIFKKFGTEVYLQYRYFTLNQDFAPGLYDITAVTIGSRVKF